MEDLKQLRDAIDGIDGKILELLNERSRLAEQIGKIKRRSGRPVYAPERAEQLLQRLALQNKGPLDKEAIRAIYREIMSASLALEKDMVIGCEGSVASRTHFAARQQFGSSVRYSFYSDPEVLAFAVVSGAADCGVIPFGENGLHRPVLNLIRERKVFLSSQILLTDKDLGIQERYLVLCGSLNAPSGDDQTALLVDIRDQSEAIASVLEHFRKVGVNVLSMKLLPTRGGRQQLFIETEGHASEDLLLKSLELLDLKGFSNLVCGSYPRLH
jgi:chorismate mutase-like protein